MSTNWLEHGILYHCAGLSLKQPGIKGWIQGEELTGLRHTAILETAENQKTLRKEMLWLLPGRVSCQHVAPIRGLGPAFNSQHGESAGNRGQPLTNDACRPYTKHTWLFEPYNHNMHRRSYNTCRRIKTHAGIIQIHQYHQKYLLYVLPFLANQCIISK